MKTPKYLVPDAYMADPAVHVLTGDCIYIPHTIGKVESKKMITAITSI